MPKGKPIGYVTCPTCDWPEMEVHQDKNGNPYAWCPECTQQLLTHGGTRAKKLLAKMRPAETPAPSPLPDPEPDPVVDPPAPEPVKETGDGWSW